MFKGGVYVLQGQEQERLIRSIKPAPPRYSMDSNLPSSSVHRYEIILTWTPHETGAPFATENNLWIHSKGPSLKSSTPALVVFSITPLKETLQSTYVHTSNNNLAALTPVSHKKSLSPHSISSCYPPTYV